MQTSLALTALLMGVFGGPHCIAMCGAACAGIASASGPNTFRSIAGFQVGRVVGYSLLGGIAALSMQGLGWLTVHSAALRPVWSLMHVAAAVLGLLLLWQGQQPAWLESAGRAVWARARKLFPGQNGVNGAPVVLGVLWSLLPCGLLYSAVLVAAMANGAVQGAMVMASFALGTVITMTLAPWLLLKVTKRRAGQVVQMPGAVQPRASDGAWGVRLAGAALAGSSMWALWMGLMHNTAPWCVTP